MKKFKFIIIFIILIFSLVGCSKKIESIPMEAINIDFQVETVDNGTITLDYPSEDWTKGESSNPEVIKVVLYSNNENLEENTNIIVGTTASSTNIPLEDYVQLLPAQLEKSSPGTKVTVAEYRKINDIPVSYIEINTKMTEEAMEYGLQKGIFTEQTIEAEGGKEAFINKPETKQIQMSISFKDRITSITGTYSKDEEKEIVLKAMQTMLQTAKLKG